MRNQMNMAGILTLHQKTAELRKLLFRQTHYHGSPELTEYFT